MKHFKRPLYSSPYPPVDIKQPSAPGHIVLSTSVTGLALGEILIIESLYIYLIHSLHF